jgi:hypothetical protein
VKVKSVRVRMFRNILDSTEVPIQPDVTCLVGKNESGKTAFLQALWRLRPARTDPKFSIADHYPAWLEKRHRIDGKVLEDVAPIEVHLEWQPADVKPVEAKFGAGVATSGAIVKLFRTYANKDNYRGQHGCNERQAVRNFLSTLELPPADADAYGAIADFDSLKRKVSEDTAKYANDPDSLKLVSNAQAAVKTLLGDKDFGDVLWPIALERMPRFFYFADYSKLTYSVKIQRVLTATDLNEPEATARALLRLGGAEKDYMLNPDYERRKRELENVANALTDDVNKYWSQNPDLRVEPDITQRTEPAPGGGQQSVLEELKLRIWDNRHSLSLPFTEHSAGFQWFFSFLAAFSEYEHADPAVVILLDEPAVGLHARAQADFLRFIEERLTPRCQVIYTTHSPFMVQPRHLERVRLVEDHGKAEGATVSADVLSRDPDTLFPLQGALGYDLVQHLFVSPNNLVVEGPSDFAYLTLLSDHLRAMGRTGLDPKWSVVPVGGADAIPTFVALLGNHLDVTVLVDSRKEGHQRLLRMAGDGYLKKQRIILIGDLVGRRIADIEDLFEPGEYLDLYNQAFHTSIPVSALQGTDAVVMQIARLSGVDRFDHGRPADVLLRARGAILGNLSAATLDRFESLFVKINATL